MEQNRPQLSWAQTAISDLERPFLTLSDPPTSSPRHFTHTFTHLTLRNLIEAPWLTFWAPKALRPTKSSLVALGDFLAAIRPYERACDVVLDVFLGSKPFQDFGSRRLQRTLPRKPSALRTPNMNGVQHDKDLKVRTASLMLGGRDFGKTSSPWTLLRSMNVLVALPTQKDGNIDLSRVDPQDYNKW